MYGSFVTPPDDAGAHFGVLFWHKDGFSTARGHGTIALGYRAVANGVVKRDSSESGSLDVIINAPSGRVAARVAFDGACDVQHVDFISVASRQISAGNKLSISTPGLLDQKQIPLTLELSFGGAVYASVDAATLGLRVEPSNYHTFVDLGRKVKADFTKFLYKNKYDLYGVCFFENVAQTPHAITQRNVVVFADGQIDRSPCSSGTCARLAVLLAQGQVGVHKHLVHESILGTQFEAFVMATIEPGGKEEDGGFPACIARVQGKANLVGKMEFFH